ncbi:site-specific DNA-methyltransferase, partial [bacterium]|nr:site-specific DNA-methyltransferase [bacterium]
PEQKVVFKADSIKSRAGRRGVHNLPDQTNPPMGFDPDKAFDSVFPFLKLPYLQPNTSEDIISFGSPEAGGFLDTKHKRIPLNAIFFGDNLHILRALPSNCIDLIYIDPPFFSGRNYNQIWGDDNEVRTFHDIWEDGLPSYLVWLNARLWEMKRVLKNTGSMYIHCDSHASHYIKIETDKIFGYANCNNEITWRRAYSHNDGNRYGKITDTILWYSKTKNYTWNRQFLSYSEEYIKKNYPYVDKDGRRYRSVSMNAAGAGPARQFGDKVLKPPQGTHWRWSQERINKALEEGKIFFTSSNVPRYKQYLDEIQGLPIQNIWDDFMQISSHSQERIGYPTQKPEALLERIIKTSSNEGDIIADFFMGGGTTCAVAQKLNRRFIGCDISRVGCSVTLNRIIKDAEEISGRTASVNIVEPEEDKVLFKEMKRAKQLSLEMTIKKIPSVHVYYMGVYPIEKFEFIGQKEFEDFILTCYEARRFTGEGEITGIMNASTSIFIGSVKPDESVPEEQLKKFVEDTLKLRYQENIKMRLKVVAWVFPPSLQKYARILENYFFKKNLPVAIELIPINSQLFRKRILEHYQDTSKSEFLLKFISQASIMDIVYKKTNGLKYKFEAVGARSNNIDGYLINCQWDFNFVGGRFAESEYALMRERKDGKYVAILKVEKEFEKVGKYIVACRIQDNLGGEAIKTREAEIK